MTTYKVCHGLFDAVHVVEFEESDTFQTGQPTVEDFSSESDAHARGFNLGKRDYRLYEPEESFESGEYVEYNEQLFLALDNVGPFFVDEETEEGLIPTPDAEPNSLTQLTFDEP